MMAITPMSSVIQSTNTKYHPDSEQYSNPTALDRGVSSEDTTETVRLTMQCCFCILLC